MSNPAGVLVVLAGCGDGMVIAHLKRELNRCLTKRETNMLRSSCGSSCSTVNVGEAERILSIGAGAMALLAGLDRRPLGALLCFATGAGLLYRGLSGHCSLYSALEMSTAAEGESTVLEPRQSEARMAPVQGATL